MENEPNKEESPIYDTDYAPKPTYKSPRLGGQATREERDRVEPGTGRPTSGSIPSVTAFCHRLRIQL